MCSQVFIPAENVFFNACLNEPLPENDEGDTPTNLFVGQLGQIDGITILRSADSHASDHPTDLQQINERLSDTLRREGIGQVSSCRFVTSPLLDEGYPVYPKVTSKSLLPWYRRYTKDSRR